MDTLWRGGAGERKTGYFHENHGKTKLARQLFAVTIVMTGK